MKTFVNIRELVETNDLEHYPYKEIKVSWDSEDPAYYSIAISNVAGWCTNAWCGGKTYVGPVNSLALDINTCTYIDKPMPNRGELFTFLYGYRYDVVAAVIAARKELLQKLIIS